MNGGTTTPLRIGIDARATAEVPAGRGRVVRELLRALARREDRHRYLLYARRPWDGGLDERFSWRLNPAHDPLWHIQAARRASREADVFLSTNSYLTVPLLRIPAVTIVYDLLTFDLAMRPNRRSLVIERLTLGPAVRGSKGLLCISQHTESELIRTFPRAIGKTSVGLLGVASALTGAEAVIEPLPSPGFILAVGTLEPRKNLPRLVAAYAALEPALRASHPLVIVGPTGWQTGETMAALDSITEHCQVLGNVSDEVLAELYRRCAVFAYPSLGEGFGLPVLEAMAAGAPVLTSATSSLPEVGGDAVEYAEPTSVEDISTALARLLGDPGRRAELAARGRERARQFSWASFAAVTLEALTAAVSG